MHFDAGWQRPHGATRLEHFLADCRELPRCSGGREQMGPRGKRDQHDGQGGRNDPRADVTLHRHSHCVHVQCQKAACIEGP